MYQIAQHYEKHKDWDNAYQPVCALQFSRRPRARHPRARKRQAVRAGLPAAARGPARAGKRRRAPAAAAHLAAPDAPARAPDHARAAPAGGRPARPAPADAGARNGGSKAWCATTWRARTRPCSTSRTRWSTRCSACCAGAPSSAPSRAPSSIRSTADRPTCTARTSTSAARSEFGACLAELDGDGWRDTIRANFAAKRGIQSPFLAWDLHRRRACSNWRSPAFPPPT